MLEEEISIALAQFAEVALAGDVNRTASYARHLAKCLRHAGDDDTASQLESMVQARGASVARPSRQATPSSRPLPVDPDSRLSMIDESEVVNAPDLVLPNGCFKIVNRFLNSRRRSHELLTNGLTVPHSMLLHGEPGCGKTLLARHIAHSLSLPLLTTRSDGLVSSFLGSTAKNIRSVFEYAADRRCVLFLDEFDSIAKMRDDRHEQGELKRVVISLLQNIDAAEDRLIFVAATNHPHLLDPAIWRRFSYSLEVPLPDRQTREMLMEPLLSSHIPKDAIQVLATISEGLSCADIKEIAEDALRDSVLNGDGTLSLQDILAIMANRQRFRDQSLSSETNTHEFVRYVHHACGKSVSQAKLGELFGFSQPQVSRILKEE